MVPALFAASLFLLFGWACGIVESADHMAWFLMMASWWLLVFSCGAFYMSGVRHPDRRRLV